MIVAETRETKTDIAVTTAEMKRNTKKNKRGTAINPRRIAKSRSRQDGTLTLVLLSTTDNRALLTNFVPTDPERWSVSGIGESSFTVAGQGDVILTATVNGEHLHGKMRDVDVPGLGINLYSIGTATDAGLKVVFDDDTVSFSQDDVFIMEGKREGKKT